MGLLTIGLDIGSTTSKAVLLADGQVVLARAILSSGTGTDGPDRVMAEVLRQGGISGERVDAVVVTGYGRTAYGGADSQMSEMSCHARGAAFLLPGVDVVVDIGGQDVKALALGPGGRLLDFVMNDKCAAGTGRFLELMARVLGVTPSELSELAAQAVEPVPISNICAVFAESEVISHLAAARSRADICAGVHRSVAKRTAGLLKRMRGAGIAGSMAMTGGVAANTDLVRRLEEELGAPVAVPPDAQAAGALGAALFAADIKHGDRDS